MMLTRAALDRPRDALLQAAEQHLLEAGFGSADTTTPDELNLRYFARRKDGLRTGGSMRILCARTADTRFPTTASAPGPEACDADGPAGNGCG